VLVEPPIATSSIRALSNASTVAMSRGLNVVFDELEDGAGGAVVERLAFLRHGEDGAVAGNAMPSASHRQFIELAVNMPETRAAGRTTRFVRACSTAPP